MARDILELLQAHVLPAVVQDEENKDSKVHQYLTHFAILISEATDLILGHLIMRGTQGGILLPSMESTKHQNPNTMRIVRDRTMALDGKKKK